MHVLLAPVGTSGDVYPFIGIGARLKSRGHRITVIANPHFEPVARNAGLEFAGIGTAAAYRAAAEDPRLFGSTQQGFPVFVESAFAPAMRPLHEQIAARWVPGETVVVGGTFALGARVAQEVLQVPLVTVHLQPTVLRGLGDLPVIAPWVPRPALRLGFLLSDGFLDRHLAPPLNAFRRELDLKPVRRVMDRWLNSPLRVLGLFPDWYAAPQPEWPPQTRLTGFPMYDGGDRELPVGLDQFLGAGEPPIFFTPGSAMYHAAEFFRVSVEVCRRLRCRGLLVTAHPGHVPGNLPEEVCHVAFAPFGRTLNRCAAIVHHGGVGTTSQALAAGIPQLVVPFSYDQPDHAGRVRRLGVGDTVLPRRYTVEMVVPVLKRLLANPSVRDRCREAASRFDGVDGLEEACRAIEALL